MTNSTTATGTARGTVASIKSIPGAAPAVTVKALTGKARTTAFDKACDTLAAAWNEFAAAGERTTDTLAATAATMYLQGFTAVDMLNAGLIRTKSGEFTKSHEGAAGKYAGAGLAALVGAFTAPEAFRLINAGTDSERLSVADIKKAVETLPEAEARDAIRNAVKPPKQGKGNPDKSGKGKGKGKSGKGESGESDESTTVSRTTDAVEEISAIASLALAGAIDAEAVIEALQEALARLGVEA